MTTTLSLESGALASLPPTPFKHWDTLSDPMIWIRKLKDTTAKRYLAPLILTNTITPRVLAYGLGDNAEKGVFHYFPNLPGELRNKIWGYAIDNTVNNVTVRWDWGGENRAAEFAYRNGDRLKSRTPPPTLLHVNREARSLMLADGGYELAFGTHYMSEKDPKIYFNFATDRLFIHLEGVPQFRPLLGMMARKDILRLRHLALPLRYAFGNSMEVFRLVSRMSHLQTVDLVLGNSPEDLRYSRDTKFLKKCQKMLNFLWEYKWVNAPKVLDRGAPKIRYEVIGEVEARILNIHGLSWWHAETWSRW